MMEESRNTGQKRGEMIVRNCGRVLYSRDEMTQYPNFYVQTMGEGGGGPFPHVVEF
jgi:hypothetical protein